MMQGVNEINKINRMMGKPEMKVVVEEVQAKALDHKKKWTEGGPYKNQPQPI